LPTRRPRWNIRDGIWLAWAARERDHEAFALRGVKFLDDRFANPALWLLTALVLYAIAVALGSFVSTPTLRSQIAVLGSAGADSAEFRALAKRGTTVGILLAVDVIVIVFLMVTKPVL
jgi:hypothetical protein